ncbi:MmgE/PrpD family protein [Terrarubrum flagellatum]|uniref:MmgE/PrpD family protein n=1 Tax=Terrirubrum flagellatum TaxID=2895980 RepID=UPI003144E950
MSHIMQRLADYVVGARGQKLSDDLRNAACCNVLDLIAATIPGVHAPGPRAFRQAAGAFFGGGEIPVWFCGQSFGLAGAIACNASAAAALDLDDGHRIARGHPGAAVIPAAFAAAQQARISTEELLNAIVVGYEVGVAVGAARRFYANTGMWSGYGVVAALGVLRNVGPEALAHAFAIAGVSAPNQLHAGAGPVFSAQEGSDVKEGIPWSSVTALHALLLAEAGHTGPLALLDNEEHFRAEQIADNLGTHGYVARNYKKFHACCRHAHAPVEALLSVLTKHDIDATEIEAIKVATYSGALRLANRPRPLGFTDIQFSIPYCLALVAFDAAQALLPLTEAAVDRPKIVALAEKVSLTLDPDIDARFPAETLSRVTVIARDQQFVSEIVAPRGEASAPPSWPDLEEKLRQASRFVASHAEQTKIIESLRRLRDGDHEPLFEILAAIDFSRM